MKLEMAEDDIPRLIRALEHYAAYLAGHQARGRSIACLAEKLKRKHPEAEDAGTEKSAKRRA